MVHCCYNYALPHHQSLTALGEIRRPEIPCEMIRSHWKSWPGTQACTPACSVDRLMASLWDCDKTSPGPRTWTLHPVCALRSMSSTSKDTLWRAAAASFVPARL